MPLRGCRLCLSFFLLLESGALAQAPTGAIAGTVYDSSGALVPNASIKVKSDTTAFERSILSNQAGQYSAPSLAAGTYDIRVEAPGFHTLDTKAVVTTGNVTTVDLHLQVGEQKETVTVATAPQLVDVERNTLDQVITRQQIQQLPLNGRSFLQLAFLSPGVMTSSAYQGDYNRAMDVSVMGNDPDRTRIAVDGARINDAVDGGTQQNFSQEIVQEFQISSVNFDLSTGISAGGAINIVTRTGSNQLTAVVFSFIATTTWRPIPDSTAIRWHPTRSLRGARPAAGSAGQSSRTGSSSSAPTSTTTRTACSPACRRTRRSPAWGE